MEHKEAMDILMKTLKKYQLSDEEKEAITKAIGILDCANLADKRIEGIIKARKAKRDRDMEL